MMMQPRLAWELARKDLRLFRADRRSAVLCFAVPILLASVFGAIFQGRGGKEKVRLPLIVVAEDTAPLTRRIVAALCASDQLQARETDRGTALEHLTEHGSGVVLILPAGFGRLSLVPGRSPPAAVQVWHTPGSMLESCWAEGVLTEIVLREAARDLLAPLRRANPSLRLERPFAVERATVTAGGPSVPNGYRHSFCGMTLQYLLFWGMDSGLLLLRERRQGVWKRLRAAPVTLPTLLAGKTLATALIAILQITITFGFGWLVFGVTVSGSVAGFVAVALAAAVLAAATGLLVAALGGNEGRARSVAIVAILTLSMLGGLWFPSFLLPCWVQQSASALPTTWAVRGLEGVTSQGMGCLPALRCAGIVLAFSAAFLAVAHWGLTRPEGENV